MKTAILYGSTMGDTERVAGELNTKLQSDIFTVGEGMSRLEEYDVIILGSSTWGWGELQDDWNGAIEELRGKNLAGKKVAVFGTGDQMGYSDTFVDAIGILAEAAADAGATIIGKTSRDGYDFSESRAFDGENLVGLAIDVNNQDDMTEARIDSWCEQLKREA